MLFDQVSLEDVASLDTDNRVYKGMARKGAGCH
jgi:hypothetical protein